MEVARQPSVLLKLGVLLLEKKKGGNGPFRKLAASPSHVKLICKKNFTFFFIIWTNGNNSDKTHRLCKIRDRKYKFLYLEYPRNNNTDFL